MNDAQSPGPDINPRDDEAPDGGARARRRPATLAPHDQALADDGASQFPDASFRRLADGSPLGMIILLGDGIAYANPAIATMLGYEVADLVGLPIAGLGKLIHPEDLAAVLERARNRFRGVPKPSRVEYRVVRKDGEVRWIEAQVSTVSINGSVGLLNALTDITDRKRSEDMLRRLSRVVHQTGDTVVVTDADGNILYANPATERLTGYTQVELLGNNPRIFSSGEQPKRFYKRLWETILAGRDFRGDFANKRKDGSLYYQETLITPVRGESGEIIQFVAIGRDVTERKLAEETIRHMAYHDALTGLPNRALFMDRTTVAIAQAKRSGSKLAVLFLDLDRLKYVNDTMGHELGDEIIKEVGLDVWNIVRDGDTVSRISGDEYAILLTGQADTEAAAAVAGRIVQATSRPRILSSQSVTVTGSVGIATYPENGTDAKSLLKCADMAMYSAKERGGNGFVAYSPTMGVRLQERASLENDLRRAIEGRQLEVRYQPQVSIASGEVVGLEALVRWRHSDRGPISPAEFIPIAEETDLIIPLQRLVISTALDQLKSWTSEGLSQFRLAINLSAASLRSPELTLDMIAALPGHGVDPSRVEFEVTETVTLGDLQTALLILNSLKDVGATIALDDFGTGYSSFGYLRHLPIDAIKLDLSLVRDICTDKGAAAIATAVLAMAGEIGLRVVAEGVETKEQLEALRRRRCDEYQGYLFSKALPADEVTALLWKASGTRKTRRRQPGA